MESTNTSKIMKQTAVEWLAEQMQHPQIFNPYIEQAKEMEKQQQDNFAIEFAEWIRIKDFQTTSKDNWIGLDMEYYTTKELLKKFKNK
jgi:hypothetical protein